MVILPPRPSVTTSTVLPRFSNSAPLVKLGISMFRSEAGMVLNEPEARLMGDWWWPVAHSSLALGSKLYQFAGPCCISQ